MPVACQPKGMLSRGYKHPAKTIPGGRHWGQLKNLEITGCAEKLAPGSLTTDDAVIID